MRSKSHFRSSGRQDPNPGQMLAVLAASFTFGAPPGYGAVRFVKTGQKEPIMFDLLGNFICSLLEYITDKMLVPA